MVLLSLCTPAEPRTKELGGDDPETKVVEVETELTCGNKVLSDGHVRGFKRYQYFETLSKKMPGFGFICGVTTGFSKPLKIYSNEFT